VTYDSTDPELALGVVRELARIFTLQVDETLGLRTGRPRGSARSNSSFSLIVRTFDEPHVEAEPIGPKKTRAFVVSGVIGLVLGLLLGVARQALDSRIRGRSDAEAWFGAPVVGALPRGLRRSRPPGVGVASRRRRRDEGRVASLDLLRARLQFAKLGIGGPTIVVTSAGFEEGKTAVAANLATSLARSGKRVVCVDADLGRPGLHRYLGREQESPGLVDVLREDVSLEDALVGIEIMDPTANGKATTPVSGSLELLPAGSPPSSIVGVLTPEAISGITDRLRERADYVVLEAPPLLTADAFALALRSDNVLVVARYGRTTRDQAESVRQTLDGLKIERFGVVLTEAPADEPSGSSYYARMRKAK
jgi:Mrp family chromosome partitioning ATPase